MSKTKEKQTGLHKVIMVGSGGVGKSALTLQFMYDEVSHEDSTLREKYFLKYLVIYPILRLIIFKISTNILYRNIHAVHFVRFV
jgi:GTPase SAR1 family protein